MGRGRGGLAELRFLVDTGSFYTAITPAVRERLGLPAGIAAETQVADGRIVATELTVAFIRLDGREAAVPVEVVDVPELLLGVSTLEALGMKVNPLTQQLEVISGFERPPTMKRFRFHAR